MTRHKSSSTPSFIPLICRLAKQKWKKRKRGKKAVNLKPRWEDDYELVENEGLFAEYLEMGIMLHLLHLKNYFLMGWE